MSSFPLTKSYFSRWLKPPTRWCFYGITIPKCHIINILLIYHPPVTINTDGMVTSSTRMRRGGSFLLWFSATILDFTYNIIHGVVVTCTKVIRNSEDCFPTSFDYSQSWVVYGIVLPTLVSISMGILGNWFRGFWFDREFKEKWLDFMGVHGSLVVLDDELWFEKQFPTYPWTKHVCWFMESWP